MMSNARPESPILTPEVSDSPKIPLWQNLFSWLGLGPGPDEPHGSEPSPCARHIYRFISAVLKVCLAYFVANWIADAFDGSSLHRSTTEWLGLSWKTGKQAREVVIALRQGLWAVFSWALFRRALRAFYRTLGQTMPWRNAVKLVIVCLLIDTGAYIGLQKIMLPEGKLVWKSMSKHTVKVYDIMPRSSRAASLAAASRFLIVPLGEELLFRAAILIALLYLFGKWPAAIGSSLLFGYAHFGQWGAHLGCFPVVCTTIFGLLSCIILFRTGRIKWCILFHSLQLMHTYLFRVTIPPFGIDF